MAAVRITIGVLPGDRSTLVSYFVRRLLKDVSELLINIISTFVSLIDSINST